MAGTQATDPSDVPEDEPWTPPTGMSPLKKVGLTLLMVMLGVIPGLLLLASDPLPDSSDEVASESAPLPEGIDAHDDAQAGDAVFLPDVPPPATPAPVPAADEEVGIEPDEDEREDRDDRPRRSHTREERSDRSWETDEQDDDGAADVDPEPEFEEPDDDRPFISLRLGRWGWG